MALLFLVAAGALPAFAGDLSVGNRVLVSSKAVTRTTYRYVYRMDVVNSGGGGYSDVSASVSSSSPSTVIEDGNLSFGDVASGATATSIDTFSIIQNRLVPFDPNSLVWTVTGTPATACVPTGPEICDGLDNDCDGTADNGIAATPTSCGEGECAATGELACVNGAMQDSCVPGPAGPEICDGLDNDCDGAADNGIAATPTSCGEGECAATGELACVNGAMQDSCVPGPAGPEVCDGLDNDCDGAADDGIAATPTSCGEGECAATGELACVNGAMQDSCVPGPAGVEICDGLDNDCDGAADNGIAATPTSCGEGECAAIGEMACVNGAMQDSCVPGPAGPEVCDDSLDNNCNGEIDEDCILTTTLHGTVVDTDGNPIAGATVKIGTSTVYAQTDANGQYLATIGETEVNAEGKVFVTANADGFTSNQTKVDVDLSGGVGSYSADLVLKKVTVQQVVSAPNTNPVQVTAEEGGQAEATLEIPAGSLVDETGNPVEEDVTVELTAIDPSGAELSAFTGGDFIAAVAPGEGIGGGDEVTLESVVLAEVTVTGNSSGTEYENLDAAAPATLDMRLPDAEQGKYPVGTQIPLWYYDEDSGKWQQEGYGTVYQKEIAPGVFEDWITGQVNHFTWWNIDWPVSSHTCWKGRLLRTNGNPITNINLQAEGVTYNGVSYGGNDGQGNGCVSVKRSDNASSPEKIVFFLQFGGQYQYLVHDGGGNYHLTLNKADATVYDNPTEAKSCSTNAALCEDLGEMRIDMNRSPVVSLSASRTSLRDGFSTTINATVVDPDGDTYTCSWTGTGLSNQTSTSATWTAPTTHGVYSIGLTCTDSLGAAGNGSITMNSVANNPPEITAAGANPYSVGPMGNSSWTASCSDPDGDSVTDYQWQTQYNGGGTIIEGTDSGSTGTATWAAPGTAGTRYQQVRCQDSNGAWGNWLTFTNYVDNRPPIVSLASNAVNNRVPVNGIVTITATATDPEGNTPLSYSWYSPGGSILFGQGSAAIQFQPSLAIGSTWVRARVADSYGMSTDAYIYIIIDNLAPTVVRIECTGASDPGEVKNCTAFAEDPNGDAVDAFNWTTWPYGGLASTSGNPVTWTLPLAGTSTLYAQARDEHGAWGNWTVVTFSVDNVAPVVDSILCAGGNGPGDVKNCTATGHDNDVGDSIAAYQWSVSYGSISSYTANPTDWSLPVIGTSWLYARAQDNHGAWGPWKNISVAVNNAVPTVTGITCSGGTTPPRPDEVFACTAVASDPDSDAITEYAWSVSGGSISSFSANPTNWTMPALGTAWLYVRARDEHGAWSNWFSTTMVVNNGAPTVTSISCDPGNQPGDQKTCSAIASDPDSDAVDAYQWSVSNGAISSSTTNPTTWTLPVLGTSTLWVRARDAYGAWGSWASSSVLVDNVAPVVSSITCTGGNNRPYDLLECTAVADDGDAGDTIAAYQWSVSNGSLSSAAANPTSWTLPSGGTSYLYARARDNHGAWSGWVSVSRTVVNTAPLVSSLIAADTSINAGETVHLTAAVSDGEGDSYTCQWIGDGGTISSPTACDTDWTAPTGSVHSPCVRAVENFGGRTGLSSPWLCVDIDVNNGPRVTLAADPFEVDQGGTAAITTTIVDPEGDSYGSPVWSASCGSLANETVTSADFTAPAESGPCLISLQVTDGRGASGSGTVTVYVGRQFVADQYLQVTVVDQYGNPRGGVHVWLDDGSDNPPAMTTDADGYVDWGDMGSTDPVTLTIAGESWGWEHHLITYRGIQPGDLTLVLPDPAAGAASNVVATFDVQTQGGNDTRYDYLEPYLGWDVTTYDDWRRGFFNDARLLENQLQRNGLFSLLAYEDDYQAGSASYLHRYGWVLDQTPAVVAGTTVNIAYTELATTYDLVVEGGYFDTMEVMGRRAGMDFDMTGGWWDPWAAEPYVVIRDRFPVDFTHIFAARGIWGVSEEPRMFEVQRLATLPDPVAVNFLDVGVELVDYGMDSPYVEFNLIDDGDAADVDFYRADFTGYNVENRDTLWTVIGFTDLGSMADLRLATPPLPDGLENWAIVQGMNQCGYGEGGGTADITVWALAFEPDGADTEAAAAAEFFALVQTARLRQDFHPLAPLNIWGGGGENLPRLPVADWLRGTGVGVCKLPLISVQGTVYDYDPGSDGFVPASPCIVEVCTGENCYQTDCDASGGFSLLEMEYLGQGYGVDLYVYDEEWNSLAHRYLGSDFRDGEVLTVEVYGGIDDVAEDRDEPNNDRASATPLAPSVQPEYLTAGDVDWYSVQLARGDRLQAVVNGDASVWNYGYFALFDSAGNYASSRLSFSASGTIGSGVDQIDFTALEDGTWYIAVAPSPDWDFTGDGSVAGAYVLESLIDTRVKVWAVNGHGYEVVNDPLTWEEARAAAEALGGHLVTVNSTEEGAWLTEAFGFPRLELHWIGAFQPAGSTEPDGNWQWVTGEEWNHTRWWPGEPNDCCSEAGDEENAALFSHGVSWGEAAWNDILATGTTGYVVEYDTPRVVDINGAGIAIDSLGRVISYLNGGATNSSGIGINKTGFVRTNSDGTDLTPIPLTAGEDIPELGYAADDAFGVFPEGMYPTQMVLATLDGAETLLFTVWGLPAILRAPAAGGEVTAFRRFPGDGGFPGALTLMARNGTTYLVYSYNNGSIVQIDLATLTETALADNDSFLSLFGVADGTARIDDLDYEPVSDRLYVLASIWWNFDVLPSIASLSPDDGSFTRVEDLAGLTAALAGLRTVSSSGYGNGAYFGINSITVNPEAVAAGQRSLFLGDYWTGLEMVRMDIAADGTPSVSTLLGRATDANSMCFNSAGDLFFIGWNAAVEKAPAAQLPDGTAEALLDMQDYLPFFGF